MSSFFLFDVYKTVNFAFSLYSTQHTEGRLLSSIVQCLDCDWDATEQWFPTWGSGSPRGCKEISEGVAIYFKEEYFYYTKQCVFFPDVSLFFSFFLMKHWMLKSLQAARNPNNPKSEDHSLLPFEHPQVKKVGNCCYRGATMHTM